MQTCLLCNSFPAKWPDGIDISFATKQLFFCELHMDRLLKYATVEDHDKEKAAYVLKYNALAKEIEEELFFWFEKRFKETGRDSIYKGGVFREEEDEINDKLSDALTRKEMGDPILRRIDDDLVTRWITYFLKNIAKKKNDGKPVYRCPVSKKNSFDGRCSFYTYEQDKPCESCAKRKEKCGILDLPDLPVKIKECFRILGIDY